VTTVFDRQFNCLTEPEQDLVWAFFMLSLDPVTPGMLESVYEAAWSGIGGVGGHRENAFANAWNVVNVHIEPFDYVISLEGAWFAAYATSIAGGHSSPFGSCPCDSF